MDGALLDSIAEVECAVDLAIREDIGISDRS